MFLHPAKYLVPPFQCWDMIEQLRLQTLIFCSTLEVKMRKKVASLPSTFDDVCSLCEWPLPIDPLFEQKTQ